MKPILERSGLRAGYDFFLAFSPERIDPGNKTYRINNTAKVVGGVDPESTELAVDILNQITEGHVHRSRRRASPSSPNCSRTRSGR
jgi:UDP-N-acetyl-D-glucosamine dehydrogenase